MGPRSGACKRRALLAPVRVERSSLGRFPASLFAMPTFKETVVKAQNAYFTVKLDKAALIANNSQVRPPLHKGNPNTIH